MGDDLLLKGPEGPHLTDHRNSVGLTLDTQSEEGFAAPILQTGVSGLVSRHDPIQNLPAVGQTSVSLGSVDKLELCLRDSSGPHG